MLLNSHNEANVQTAQENSAAEQFVIHQATTALHHVDSGVVHTCTKRISPHVRGTQKNSVVQVCSGLFLHCLHYKLLGNGAIGKIRAGYWKTL